MLSSLHIRNYILIDSLDITFPEGLIIITGQTGAGKSIILGALSLLSGARADASAIKEGADSCVVEAEFTGVPESLKALMEENDLEWDGGCLTIRRVVSASGRSRGFVNDCPAPVSVLQALAERLIDIHSQHKSLLITDRNFQLEVLDLYAHCADKAAKCRGIWQEMRRLQTKLSELRERQARMSADSDYNSAQYAQLSEAGLRAGELEELEAEQKSLSAAEQIKESLSRSLELFNPSSDEQQGIALAVRELKRQLDYAGKYIPEIEQLAQRVESVKIELDDIQSEVDSLDSGMDLSAERLQAVDERLSLLYTLMKKHSCSGIEELIETRDRYGAYAGDADSLSETIAEAEKSLALISSEYDSLSAELHEARTAAAGSFASSILETLVFLELDRSRFEVSVRECQAGPSGKDEVNFLFSANGTAPAELSKCASGGEISRIMLCLKEMMARFVGMPTLIFDEIDTGVSGSVADKMGRMVCRMGANMQVFSITHLPQVAAKGNAHYLVSKESVEGRTISSIHRIEGDERINEIARLLSGSEITDAAVANAKSLLQSN